MRKRNTWVAYKSHIDNFDWLKKILYMNKTLPYQQKAIDRSIDGPTNQPTNWSPANQPTESIFEYLNNHKNNDVAHSKSSGTWDGPTAIGDWRWGGDPQFPKHPTLVPISNLYLNLNMNPHLNLNLNRSPNPNSIVSCHWVDDELFFNIYFFFEPHCQGAKELQRFP